MSAPLALILGFGEPGSLLQKSLDGVACRYLSLPGSFADLTKPQPAVWRAVASALEEHTPDLVVWAQDTLILWDRLHRALAVNHEPDFLWPLSLTLKDGRVTPSETDLFLAVGGFELSLFHFTDLYDFHHAVRGRALAKLLAVTDVNTMTIGDYLYQSWLNFESVKAPDPWLIANDESFVLTGLDTATAQFKAQHRQWQMGRVALEVQSRNTLATSDVARSNLDAMQSRMAGLMKRLPYHGFWPVKAGKEWMVLPSHGHHPVVQSLIWRGAYCGKSIELWNAIFCQGTYKNAIDTRDDGHLFGLLFAAQQKGGVVCRSSSLENASRAQSAAEANALTVNIQLNTKPKPDADGIAAVEENDDALWGKMDLFIPLDGSAQYVSKRSVPAGYTAFLCEEDRLMLNQVTDLNAIGNASALLIIKNERAAKFIGGGKS